MLLSMFSFNSLVVHERRYLKQILDRSSISLDRQTEIFNSSQCIHSGVQKQSTCLYSQIQLDFISSPCQKHFPLMCSFSSINLWSCKLQCLGWLMDGQDIGRRKGTLTAFWAIHRKTAFLCLDRRATSDAAVHCCSLRWKLSDEVLWHTQSFFTAPASCSLCYSTSCGAVTFGLSWHVSNNFHFVRSLKKQSKTLMSWWGESQGLVVGINTGYWFYLCENWKDCVLWRWTSHLLWHFCYEVEGWFAVPCSVWHLCWSSVLV